MTFANNDQYLGKVYLPATPGTPVGKFEFILSSESLAIVEIGLPVTAVTSEGVVVGVVTDMRVLGNSGSPIEIELSGRFPGDRIGELDDICIATAQVFYSEFIRPVRSGYVRNATSEELSLATGAHKLSWPVIAGAVKLGNGEFSPVSLDGSSLLGPESAHLMIGGLSGQAAKTSFAGVLLKSAIESGKRSDKKVAAIIFNVKGEDLVWLDKEPADGYELSEIDLRIYQTMQLTAEPFKDVTIFAPSLPGGHGTRSVREDAIALRWDLMQVWPYLKYFFPWMHEDEKLSAFIAEFSELCLKSKNPATRIDTFGKLSAWFDEILKVGDMTENANPVAWRSHHIATIRRVRRMLTTLPARCGGLLTDTNSYKENDLQLESITEGSVTVVDIANMSLDVQSVVIARILDKLLKASEEGSLSIDNLIVFVDELNTWAPSQGSENSSIKRILQKIATQGRYAGVSLWGCGQKLSKVDEMVRDNAATKALGMTSDSEIASGVYGKISTGVAERLATLPKGHMLLWHYLFRASIAVQFPRPSWKTGKSINSTSQYKKLGHFGLEGEKYANLIDSVPEEVVNSALEKSNSLKEFRESIQSVKSPEMSQLAVHEKSTFDSDNPYEL